MTSPVDPARAGEFVRIDPPVPVIFAPDWRGLKIPGAFEPEKRYRVTLEAGLPAAAAGSPGETVPRTVWFDHLPPKLEFASGDGYLRPGGLLRIPVRSRNVGRFTARLAQALSGEPCRDGDAGLRTRELRIDGKRNAEALLRHPAITTPGAVLLRLRIEAQEPCGRRSADGRRS